MRVLIVSTSEKAGGAALAAERLVEALINNGVKTKMLVAEKVTDSINVAQLPNKLRYNINFLWERWCLFLKLHFSRKNLFAIDIANAGTDITRLPEFKEADIIHLHWINQGMLSLSGIRKILVSGKPVVWTMHDIWPATALCHITLGCNNFKSACRKCKYLPSGGSNNDLSARVWQRKQNMLKGHTVHFVACSKWLENEAKQSALLKRHVVKSIPNTIDTQVFAKSDKKTARERLGLPQDKRLVLFVSQRVTNEFKGMDYLVEACNKLTAENKKWKENTAMVILGGHAEEVAERFAPLPVIPLGYINDTQSVVDAYNAADIFVLPSLSENLPNTIMEAMACGVPCVGFDIGGIPEEIDHKLNGYVARYRDADDLAAGLYWTVYEANHELLSANASAKVHSTYSQQSVAKKYISLYREALAYKNFNL